MATHLSKSDPSQLAFRINPPGSFSTLQAAQAFTVMFGQFEHAAFRAGEHAGLHMPDGTWVPGAKFIVIADRDGGVTRRGLTAIPEAEADYFLGLPIGGFTIGPDSHPDPATAWDIATARFSVPIAEMGAGESRSP